MPRLSARRPGADYQNSLNLLKGFKQRFAHVLTKSGLMVGLGETDDEIVAVMRDLRAHDVDMLTIGQYLQPSLHHLPVTRYVEPAVFDEFALAARALGFMHAACGPLVRSSYHADQQAHEAGVAIDHLKTDGQSGVAYSSLTLLPSPLGETAVAREGPGWGEGIEHTNAVTLERAPSTAPIR